MPPPSSNWPLGGTQDGTGAGDHDVPYTFGRRPRASAPYPFSTRQYLHLLVLRSRIDADLFGCDDRVPPRPWHWLGTTAARMDPAA